MWRNKWLGAVVAVAMIFAFAGCDGGKSPSDSSSGEKQSTPEVKKPARKFKVGFSHSNMQEPWRVAMWKSMEREWKANYSDTIDLTMTDGQGENAKQRANTEGFLAKGIDLLIISPHEAQPQTPPVKTAYEKGIKVLVLDRKIVGDTYNTFIGGDNFQIGEEAGKWCVEQFKGKDMEEVKVVHLQGQSGATPTTERREGFMKVIKAWNDDAANKPKFTIIFDQFCDYQREKAKAAMENALQAHPEIDLVYTHNDPMAIGASLAAQSANRRDKMLIVGIDALTGPSDGVQAVLDGKIDVTFVYPPLGKEAIELAAKLLKKEKVEKNISLDTTTIDKTNAQKYMDENK
jgi:ribose transport system substrate-binding protein